MTREWPKYVFALNLTDGDRSKADLMYCCWSLARGWKPEEIEAKLAEVSDKAKSYGITYIRRTVEDALRERAECKEN